VSKDRIVYDNNRQRFWLFVYTCFETPASWLRRGALWAIGKAGDATDWGEP